MLVLAGSRRYSGAPVLASVAALRSGAGLVTLGVPKGLRPRLGKLPPEIMVLELPETKEGSLSLRAEKLIRDFIFWRKISALAIGPGLSIHPETARLVRKIVRYLSVPAALDADGLNSFREFPAELKKHASDLVLTPHAREFERLFDARYPSRIAARANLAKRLSRIYDVVLVLKGHPTLVAEKSRFFKNTTGNPGMAKGGSGDVLTGMVAAFLAQRLSAFQAARWAVYFHGKAADRAVKKTGELGLTASDIIDTLPQVLR